MISRMVSGASSVLTTKTVVVSLPSLLLAVRISSLYGSGGLRLSSWAMSLVDLVRSMTLIAHPTIFFIELRNKIGQLFFHSIDHDYTSWRRERPTVAGRPRSVK